MAFVCKSLLYTAYSFVWWFTWFTLYTLWCCWLICWNAIKKIVSKAESDIIFSDSYLISVVGYFGIAFGLRVDRVNCGRVCTLRATVYVVDLLWRIVVDIVVFRNFWRESNGYWPHSVLTEAESVWTSATGLVAFWGLQARSGATCCCFFVGHGVVGAWKIRKNLLEITSRINKSEILIKS